MECKIDGTSYKFFWSRMNGIEVVAHTANNGTESNTEWSAEASRLPGTEEEAREYLTAYAWETVSFDDDFVAVED